MAKPRTKAQALVTPTALPHTQDDENSLLPPSVRKLGLVAAENRNGQKVGLHGEEDGHSHLVRRRRDLLPMPLRAEIVVKIAQFQPLTQIAADIEREHGIRVPHRTLSNYDPNRSTSRLGKRLRALHAEARKRWLENNADIGIVHQNHRLRALHRIADKAEEDNAYDVAMRALKQAAEELGGMVQRVRHEGRVEHRHISVDEAKEELKQRLSQVIDGGDLEPANLLISQDNPEI